MLRYPVSPAVAADIDAVVHRFNRSGPVKYVVIDDFLDADYASKLFSDLPDLTTMPKSRDYMFSDKRELSTLDKHSDLSRELHEIFMSQDFADLASRLVGRTVFIDPEYVGGGFHAGDTGSFLDLHVDFNIHPAQPTWFRELNILLYLNPGWEASWGGELLLTDHPERVPKQIEPRFNRLVIMECTDSSFHGYKAINFPSGHSRRSIAAYGYSAIPAGSVSRHTTNWAPEDASFGKRLLARNWNRIVLTKNHFFGSGTLKNRR